MTSGSACTRPRRSVTCCLARARKCLSARPSIELRSSGTARSSRLPRLGGLGPGALRQRAPVRLVEHVLALGLVPGDGHVAVLVVTVAAAAELELRPDLVERPAVADG